METVSGNGWLGRANKPVPRSAAAHGSVKSVPPSERHRGRRQTASAVAQRVPVSPPVCGVHPGKVLELRTTLGLMRTRALLDQTLRHSLTSEPHVLSSGHTRAESAGRMKGQLKTGRLQPLGVVADADLTADDCLGVVPVTSHKEGYEKRRPRSSSTPGVHFKPFNIDAGNKKPRERDKMKPRSYSAVSARSLDSSQLLQLLTVSKQTGLLPQGDTEEERFLPSGATAQADTKIAVSGGSGESDGERIQFLPPVVSQGELGLKVEVKRFTKLVPSESSTQPQLPKPPSPSGGQGSPRAPKLPPLIVPQTSATPPPQQNQKSPFGSPNRRDSHSKAGQTDVASQTSHEQTDVAGQSDAATVHKTKEKGSSEEGREKGKDRSLQKVRIVSLGESDNGPRSRANRRRRHSSGSQTGRLSLGWSTPQAINEVLKGSSLSCPGDGPKTPVDKHNMASRDEQNTADILERAVSPNILNVNVSAVLIEAEMADNSYSPQPPPS